jgi:O-antigen ligase
MSLIATFVCIAVIAGLFYLDRDAQARVSKALWIPTIWMLIVGSRAVSEWGGVDHVANLSQRNADGSPLDAAIYGALIVAGLLVVNFRADRVRGYLHANGPILLFLGYCALSVLWCDSPFVALKRWIKGAGVLVMVLVIVTDADPIAAMRRVLSRAAFVLLPASVFLILFFPQLGSSFDEWSHITYYCGVTTQKNELGLTCLVCGLGSLWSLIGAYEVRSTVHGRQRMLAHGLMFVTAIWLIKTCDSMTSMASLGISAVVLGMTTVPIIRKRPRNIHMLLGGAAIAALLASFADLSGAVLGLLGRDATLTGRTDIWKAVLSFHTNPLIGTGYESFWLGGRIDRVGTILGYKGIAEAHNGYLQIYLDLGWIGLGLLAAMIMSGYFRAVDELAWNRDAGRIRLALIAAGMVASMTEAGFAAMTLIWFAFLLANTHVPQLGLAQVARTDLRPSLQRRGVEPRQTRILR